MKKLLKILSNKKVVLGINIFSWCLFAFMAVVTIVCFITKSSGGWTCLLSTIYIGAMASIPMNKKTRKNIQKVNNSLQ